jgi:hypothetical protein
MIGAVLLYRALRSIWPLVIGHIIYDILTGILQSTTTLERRDRPSAVRDRWRVS